MSGLLGTQSRAQLYARGSHIRFRFLVKPAHRVNTILDSDRIIVMEKGEIAEFDAPSVLLAKPDGLFRALVSEASQAASAANDAAEAAAATGSAEAKAS